MPAPAVAKMLSDALSEEQDMSAPFVSAPLALTARDGDAEAASAA